MALSDNDPISLSKPVVLPIELWLEIFSYLPRKSRRKTIGINRIFYELVLDELYKELRIVNDDQETLHRFTQLRNEAIATRVRRLLICPTFLSGLEGHKDTATGTPAVTAKTANGVTLLETAERNIKLCSNIHELGVILGNQAFTFPFKYLLISLWHPDAIAPKLRTLTLSSPPAKFAELLGLSMYNLSGFMKNLQHLNIVISVDPGISGGLTQAPLTNINFKPFLETFKHQLKSFSVIGLLPQLFDPYKNLPTFTRLLSLTFFVIANPRNLFWLEEISRCILKQANTLESLRLKFRFLHPEGAHSYGILPFFHWFTFRGSHQTFSSLLLPRLRVMELGFPNSLGWDVQNCPMIFPDFARVAPMLREFRITDNQLPFSRVCELVDRLSTSYGRCTLERLNFSVNLLSPEVMDLLVEKMPDLKFLELHLLVATDHMAQNSPDQFAFCETIRTRNYSAWRLKYLRITSWSLGCITPHPNVFIMKTVAATLSSDITLHTSYLCDCDSSL